MTESVMKNLLSILDNTLMVAFFLCNFIFFYLSIKKCFWKEGMNKVKLFFMTAITNPFVSIVGSLLITRIVFDIVLTGLGQPNLKVVDYSVPLIILAVLVPAVSYLLLIILASWVLGKWLRVKAKASILFISLMYNAIVIFQFREVEPISADGAWWIPVVLDCISVCVGLILIFILYFLDARALSKLSQDDSEIDWRIFNIPPAIFVALFMASLIPVIYSDNKALVNTFSVFSIIIVFLLIWAFNVIIKNIQATHEIKTLSVEVMEALAHTIDAKDEYTRGHSVRVAKYSRILAKKLGLSDKECENVYYMGLLHDIGKIGVPNDIINSKSRLTDEEYAVIKTHPGVGFGILAEIKSRPDLTIGARWHHERYDGKGYPDGKAGTDIPYFARIIAVADTYDAMTSNRSYRAYMPQQVVRAEIEKNAGTQFDPDIAKCMLEIIDEDKNYEMHE